MLVTGSAYREEGSFCIFAEFYKLGMANAGQWQCGSNASVISCSIIRILFRYQHFFFLFTYPSNKSYPQRVSASHYTSNIIHHSCIPLFQSQKLGVKQEKFTTQSIQQVVILLTGKLGEGWAGIQTATIIIEQSCKFAFIFRVSKDLYSL